MRRLLDLFCSAFGAGHGYQLAGFDVIGVDRVRRRDHPEGVGFLKADCVDVMTHRQEWLRTFDFIHASPPCQTHSRTKHLRDAQGKSAREGVVDLIAETRDALTRSGVPFVIENVPGAPLRQDLLLCGSMFPELHVFDSNGDRRWLQRHRVFEFGNVDAVPSAPGECDHDGAGVRPFGVYGSRGDDIPSGGQTCRTVEQAQQLMGMPWAGWASLVEAIPPAYTRHIGSHLLRGVG